VLRIEREGSVAIWTIDRAETKNALDAETMGRLSDAVRDATNDRTLRAAVLTGAGHMFVSGGDLRELRDRSAPQDAERLSDAGYELCRQIVEAPFPVIAALAGPAIGGGAELAVACDLRVADVRAKICFKQVRMGVTTAWGTVPRLVALVGASSAARLLYTAHELPAAAAKLLGIFDDVTENGLARATAIAWASDIAQGSPRAIADMKRIVQETIATSRDLRALERQLFVDNWSGADHIEAVEAYFERRVPRWHDR
jgi:enoyl-CoA hydratase